MMGKLPAKKCDLNEDRQTRQQQKNNEKEWIKKTEIKFNNNTDDLTERARSHESFQQKMKNTREVQSKA